VVATTCATGVEIAPGGTYGCTFTLVVASDEAATVPDEVVATVVDDDGTEATAGDAAVTTVTAVADLAIEKRLLDEALIAGEEATYELAVTNLGPSTAAGVVVTDTVPEPLVPLSGSGEGWTCTVDEQVVRCTTESLAPESTSVVQVRVEVPVDAAALEVTNVGEVVSDTEDPDDENNRDEVTHEIGDAEPIDEDRPPPAGPIDAVIVATGGPQGFLAMVGALALIAGMAALAARRLAEDRRG
jgi:uncharacterized repeat protein (TIGR01451 family)